jgi:hypothetical protein
MSPAEGDTTESPTIGRTSTQRAYANGGPGTTPL